VFFVHLPKCLFVLIVIYLYFINILQGNVKTHLRCCGIYNNHIVANYLQSVPVASERILNINNWRRYEQKESATFFMDHPVYHMCVRAEHAVDHGREINTFQRSNNLEESAIGSDVFKVLANV